MILTGLARLIESDAALDRATGSLASGRSGVLVMPKGARPPAIAALARSAQARPALVLTATGRDAERLTNALRSWIDGVEMMPAWETLPHERLSPQVDTMARRIAVLRRLAHPVEGDKHAGPISVLVVPIRAFLQPVISGLGELEPVRVRPGDRVDLEDLAHRLAALGYERVDMVESRGQLSVRGGILDVFPPQEAHPVRVELWDDEVDEIRAFSVQDQRTLGLLEEGLWAPACRELLLTDAVRARARDLSDDLPGAAEMLSLASEGIAAPGIESLAPVLASGMDRLIDLVPNDSPILAADPERIRARAADLVATTEEFLAAAWSVAAGGGATPLQASAASFLHLDDLIAEGGRPWWELTELPPAELAGIDEDAHESVEGGASPSGPRASVVSPTLMRMGMREVRPYRGDFAAACHDLKALADAHWTIVVATEGPGPAKRIRTILAESGLHAAFVEDLGQTPEAGT
ncbi:MAG: transcription-repair coupling factor, partial [Schaalia hyovaginalis]|nr:transcription-repair coupling factor [Schaalia hyovaginalis]